MKRLMLGLGLLLVATLIALVWSATRSPTRGAIQAIYLCHTNVNAGHGTALLQITNQTSDDYAIGLEAQRLVSNEWVHIRYNLTVPGPNSSYSGWLGGHSNVLIHVAAPEKDERFCLQYQRVPTKAENYISWAFGWIRLRNPLAPRMRTEVVYPDPKHRPG